MLSTYDEGYLMSVNTPVGVVFGKYTGLQAYDGRPEMYLVDAEWFPWATDRNKLESMVNLFNRLRWTMLIKFYAREKDDGFYYHIAKHGILRCVGRVHGFFKNGHAIEFQGKDNG